MINYDITGKDTVSSLDRMRYHKKRLPILKGIGYTTLILGALGGIGFGVYKLMQNPTKLNSIKKNLACLVQDTPQEETPVDRRTRLLIEANEQLSKAKNYLETRGIIARIEEINQGKYDYPKKSH